MLDDMRGLFFIVKGGYVPKVEPSFVNKVTGDVQFIGGYDPHDPNTNEWYMLMDCKTFHCICCGSTLDTMLKGVKKVIKDYKGVAKNYFKHLSHISSEDYYEVTYLGKTPLSLEARNKRAEGRCPRVSPIMAQLYTNVYKEYGDYFEDQIKEMEEEAYEELVIVSPFKKAQKMVKKLNTKGVEEETPKKGLKKKETPVEETPTLKKVSKPKVKLGIKKI